ncbi:hypothetical protein LNTAR_01877 [Lentisphaera araneosa HTCC2155]|uniref:Glycerol kinase n=1 Tax=Lentisphaera araneosa HTCC2155 TaxID=313628 RepID=A6DNY5_9BACT|nr:hypothetical protein [Lentisphaera araneosa]EDM26517.1 hypothetical protein LNTAR_01877 [Lentisphaera araneosa HTCC2155]
MNTKKISSSQLSKANKLQTREVFAQLLAAGLTTQVEGKWQLTDNGKILGGEIRSSKQYGDYIVWPEDLLQKLNSAPESSGQSPTTAAPGKSKTTLSSTKIGSHFSYSASKINKILAELGWIEKGVKGWKITDAGRQHGGVEQEHYQSGIPYTRWPESILQDSVLTKTVESLSNTSIAPPQINEDKDTTDDYRKKYPANIRTHDGHRVRSRGEAMIDNWLYISGIVHAYERRLPIEEDVLCDFYIPHGKVYIEYWGLEEQERYAARKKQKQEIYAKYGYKLIELTDSDIESLDDVLPRKLLKFGISTE